MDALRSHVHLAYRSKIIPTAFAALIVLSLSAPSPEDGQRASNTTEGARFAGGILVQPDAGALEPPSIADENDDRGDDSGEEVPAVLEPRGAVVIPAPVPVPDSPEQELERPGARQDDLERGGGRQGELETPEGPGIKY